jgi:hypothetical protein
VVRSERLALHAPPVLGRVAIAGDVVEEVVLGEPDRRPVRAAQPCRRLHQSVEHSLQIESRAADHLEHVGGGGLLLQRFAQFAGTLLHFVEQPHVLDRNHGLVGEGFEQCDLLVREWPDLHPAYQDRADRTPFAQQWRRQRGAMAVASRVPAAFGKIVFLGGEVVDVNGPTLEHRAAGHPATVDRQPPGGMAGRWQPAIRGDLPEKFALQAEDHRIVRVA